MSWIDLINHTILELNELQGKLQRYIQQKIPPQILISLRQLQDKQRVYRLLDRISKHVILFVLITGLTMLSLYNSGLDHRLVTLGSIIILIILLRIIQLDWKRKQDTRQLYLDLAAYLEGVSGEIDHELVDDRLLDRYISKVEDIINIRNIIQQIEADSRISENTRGQWYQIWVPSLISFLNEFYGYPDSVILSRIEFQKKLFERVVLTAVIGFAFLMIRTLSLLSASDFTIFNIITTVSLLVFLIGLLLLISFPVVRYPALKEELALWIEEHELSLHIINDHPHHLLEEYDVNWEEIHQLTNQKVPEDSPEVEN